MDRTMEKRIYKDVNGSYNVQTRFVPALWFECNDGWGTCYITSIYDNAKKIFDSIKAKGVK